MEFGILGPLRVSAGGDAIKLGGPLQRGLLAELLITPNAAVSDDQLIDDLWGEHPPPSARHLLEVYVSRLRAVLGAGPDGLRRIERAGPGYAIRIDTTELDASRFLAVSAEGQRLAEAEPAIAERSLISALDLWRGSPFADIVDPPPAVRVQSEYLERERRAALQARFAVGLRLGRHRQLAPELARLVEAQPYDEALCGSLMLALYRSGCQADALQAGRSLRTRLREELGVDPSPELTALYRQILVQDPDLLLEVPEPPSSLPRPLTSFVGREAELATVAQLVAEARVVTLTGPAGVGKTRLAIEAAHEARRLFPDGIVWFDVSAATGPDGLAPAFASAVGVTTTTGSLDRAIASALARRRVLLLFDNCETLAQPVAALVTQILRSGTGVHVLATSRTPLRIEGERRWPVPPLSLPSPDDLVDTVGGGDAVALFLERGRAVNASFRAQGPGLADVVEVCRRLDGLPLAIEMAAARLHVLTPREMTAGLDARFELLTLAGHARASRHGALEATLEVSYAALPAGERAAFARLGVFSGPFDRAAAGAVAFQRPDSEALDGLRDLVDASMVVAEQAGGTTRYRLLETLKAFALRRLEEAGDDVDARTAHARHFLGRAASAACELNTPAFAASAERLARDGLELEAALDWSLRHEPRQVTLAAAPALRELWYRLGEARQAGVWARRMLAGDLSGVAPALLCEVHNAAAFSGNLSLDLAGASAHVDAATALARESGQTDALVFALWGGANVALASGDLARMRQMAGEALEAADSIGGDRGRWARARPLSALGYAALFGGSAAEARPRFAESAVLFRELDDRASLIIMALVPLVRAALRDGDAADAERIAAEAVDAARNTAWEAAAVTAYAWAVRASGDPAGAEVAARRGVRAALGSGLDQWVGMALYELAECAAATGRIPRAATLLGAARRYLAASAVEPSAVAALEARCCAEIGRQRFEILVAEGSALDAGAIDGLASAR